LIFENARPLAGLADFEFFDLSVMRGEAPLLMLPGYSSTFEIITSCFFSSIYSTEAGGSSF